MMLVSMISLGFISGIYLGKLQPTGRSWGQHSQDLLPKKLELSAKEKFNVLLGICRSLVAPVFCV